MTKGEQLIVLLSQADMIQNQMTGLFGKNDVPQLSLRALRSKSIDDYNGWFRLKAEKDVLTNMMCDLIKS